MSEKLRLIEEIWDGLRSESDVPIPDWHRQVLDERRRALEAGETAFVDWDTAKREMRAQLGL